MTKEQIELLLLEVLDAGPHCKHQKPLVLAMFAAAREEGCTTVDEVLDWFENVVPRARAIRAAHNAQGA